MIHGSLYLQIFSEKEKDSYSPSNISDASAPFLISIAYVINSAEMVSSILLTFTFCHDIYH